MTPTPLGLGQGQSGPQLNTNSNEKPLATNGNPFGQGQPLTEAAMNDLITPENTGGSKGANANISNSKPVQQNPSLDTLAAPLSEPQGSQFPASTASAHDAAPVQAPLSNKEKARQSEEDVKTFCLALTQDANADVESCNRAKQFLESKETKDKVNRDLEELYAQIEAKKIEQAEAAKRVKDQAKLMTAEKRTKDLGYSRIKAPVTDSEIERLFRDNFLSVGGQSEADENEAKQEQISPAEWITKHLGKGARTRLGGGLRPLGVTSNPDKNLEMIGEFIFDFSAHFAEVKDWIRKLNGSVNEMIQHHNKTVDTKLVEFQRPSYARAAAMATPMDPKKVMKFAAKEVEKQFQARQQADAKHALEREKTVRQILGIRIPEIHGIDTVKDKSEVARREAENFVAFTNDLLKGQRKKGNKKFLHVNQIETIHRVEWPGGHKGIDLNWDRRIHVTLKPGSEQVVFDIIQAQNWMCAQRNREIAEGTALESDRIHRHLQIQLTASQKKEHAKLQAWCHRTNATNREADPNCKLWFVFFREDGTPFQKLIVDRHPQRLAELEHHWKPYRDGGPKSSRRKLQGRPTPGGQSKQDHNSDGFRQVTSKKTRPVRITAQEHAMVMAARARMQGNPEDIPVGAPLLKQHPPPNKSHALGASGTGPLPHAHMPSLPPLPSDSRSPEEMKLVPTLTPVPTIPTTEIQDEQAALSEVKTPPTSV